MTSARPRLIELAVTAPAAAIRVVWVAGVLDQLAVTPSGGTAHLIIDLAGVRCFGIGGMAGLRHAGYTCSQAGMGLHLTGLAAHEPMLPPRVAARLSEFSTFPTVEDAIAALRPFAPDVDLVAPVVIL